MSDEKQRLLEAWKAYNTSLNTIYDVLKPWIGHRGPQVLELSGGCSLRVVEEGRLSVLLFQLVDGRECAIAKANFWVEGTQWEVTEGEINFDGSRVIDNEIDEEVIDG